MSGLVVVVFVCERKIRGGQEPVLRLPWLVLLRVGQPHALTIQHTRDEKCYSRREGDGEKKKMIAWGALCENLAGLGYGGFGCTGALVHMTV